jgi:ATP-dependent Lon protease
MGLAWTEMGGILLPVEVVTMPGKGELFLTGQLGDVMRESVMAALSYIRTRADELNIDTNFQDTTDLHIHLPEGAIPKDGPSAGITMATAVISALSRRPVRGDLAMTGEVTLLGNVLSIGGLKEKVLAAAQAQIKQLVIPAANQKDLQEIPLKIRQQLKFTLVDNMDQVIEAALEPPPEQLSQEPKEEAHTEPFHPVPMRREEQVEHARPTEEQELRRRSLPSENPDS